MYLYVIKFVASKKTYFSLNFSFQRTVEPDPISHPLNDVCISVETCEMPLLNLNNVTHNMTKLVKDVTRDSHRRFLKTLFAVDK